MAKDSRKKKKSGSSASPNVPATAAVAQRPPSWSNRDWFWALLLVLPVILAYLPLWRAGYMWDDNVIVSTNPCVVGPLGLKEIWTTSAARFYPLVLTTFWLEHALWGLAPLPYHLVNILFHAASAVVLWRVLWNLEVRGAWLGAALWALHPVQVETVAWISEMKNTESCLFYLLTILFFVKGLKAGIPGNRSGGNPAWNYALSLLCAALAMASKSSTLLLPVVLGLCAWWVKGRWHWRDMVKVGLFLLMSIAAGAIILQIVQRYGGDELHWAQSWQERVATAGGIFWFYLGKLVWPHPLMSFYPRWEVDTGRWTSYLPIAAVALVLIVLWLNRQSWSRPWFFALAYYLISLLPVMGLFSVTGFRYSLVEDHLQYLASMGPLALAGAGLAGLSDLAISRRVWLPFVPGAALLLILGTLSWRQAWVYQNENAFWVYNVAQNPTCWVAYNGLGVGFAQKGQADEAIEQYQKSLAINPNFAETHSNLGVALASKGQMNEAIAEYQKALAINPRLAVAHLKLGEALLTNGQVDNAIAQYQKVLDIDPHFALAHNNLGVALFQNGHVTEAIAQYQKALEIDPGIAQTHNNLGLALTQMGVVFLQRGQADEAIARFQEALKNDPTLAQAHSDLGIVFAQKGQANEALAQFREALRLKPDDSAARINLEKIQAMIQQKTGSP